METTTTPILSGIFIFSRFPAEWSVCVIFAEARCPRKNASCDTCIQACLLVRFLLHKLPQCVANAGPSNDRCECSGPPSSTCFRLLSGCLLNIIVTFFRENGSLPLPVVPNVRRLQFHWLQSSSFRQATLLDRYGEHCACLLYTSPSPRD